MKRDLRNDLDDVSRLRTPDLWTEIESRSRLPEHASSASRPRVPALIVGVLVMIVGVGAPLLALRGNGSTGPAANNGPREGTGILITDASAPELRHDIGTATVVLSSVQGDATTLLSEPGMFQGDAAWSPDGSRFAAVRGRPGYSLDIWTYDATGGDPAQVTSFGWLGSASTPAWSPDGTKLAFAGPLGAADGKPAVFVVGVDGGNPQPVLVGLYGSPAWSPDGTSLVLVSDPTARSNWHNQVDLLDLQTGDLQPVTSQDATYGDPQWLPDGKTLLVTVASTIEADRQDIAQVDVASGHASLLTDGGWNAYPVVSPDGARFAYAHATGSAPGATNVFIGAIGEASTPSGIYQGSWRAYPTAWR